MKNINNPPITRRDKNTDPNVLAASLAENTNKLKGRKTPYDYGCVGDGVTDDSANFLKFLTQDTNKQGYVPVGTFLIATSSKMPLISLTGESQTGSVIKFTHPNGGFQKYNQGTYNGYGGFANLSNLTIDGNNTCNYLIDVGNCSEGTCDNVYFANVVSAAFKIDNILELVFFKDCTISNMPRVFEVASTADPISSINAVFIRGGNFYNITDTFVSTSFQGIMTIDSAWIERVNTLLTKIGNYSFTLQVLNCRILKTQGTGSLINVSCKGSDSINFHGNNMYFALVTSYSIFNVTASGDNNCNNKLFKFTENTITADQETNLTNIFTADLSLAAWYVMRLYLNKNDISYTFSWWSAITSKTSMVIVSGFDDVKLGHQVINNIKINSGDQQATIMYDASIKQLYVSDSNGVNKYHLLKSNSFPTTGRPTGIQAGYMGFDATLGKPVWYNGSVWKDATGTTV